MSVLSTTLPTLLDQVKRTDPDGRIASIVEALQQRNPILQDAVAMEGNLPTGHRVTIRQGLPTVGYRLLNQGIAASKSTTIQVDETCALLEGRSEVDCELARLNGNEAAFRLSEDIAFLQAMNNQASTDLFYASTLSNPEKFHGLTPRYNALTANANSENVIASGISASGSDQHSIWFITWGPDTCYMIYPKGTPGGLEHIDMGKEYVEDADSNKFLAWRSHYIWRLGLCVKDWRYVVRVCNIDASAFSATGTQLISALIDGYNHVHDLSMGRTVIYCNRTVQTFIDQQVMNKDNVYFTPMEWGGKTINSFRGIPIRTCDALVAEAVVA